MYLEPLDTIYNMRVIRPGDVNPDNSYTLSAEGVTRFSKDGSDFTSLEQFEREFYLYNMVIQVRSRCMPGSTLVQPRGVVSQKADLHLVVRVCVSTVAPAAAVLPQVSQVENVHGVEVRGASAAPGPVPQAPAVASVPGGPHPAPCPPPAPRTVPEHDFSAHVPRGLAAHVLVGGALLCGPGFWVVCRELAVPALRACVLAAADTVVRVLLFECCC